MKIFSVLAAILLTSSFAFGQRLGGDHNEAIGAINTGFGLRGGLNFAYPYGSGSALSTSSLVTYHGGAYAKLGFSPRWALQIEGIYSRKGGNISYQQLNPTTAMLDNHETKYRFNYLDAPVLAVFNIIPEHRLSIMAGPMASIMITAKEEDNEISQASFNTFEFSGVIGIQAGFSAFRVGARYNHGFTDIIKSHRAHNQGFPLAPYNFRNSVTQLYVGVEF